MTLSVAKRFVVGPLRIVSSKMAFGVPFLTIYNYFLCLSGAFEQYI